MRVWKARLVGPAAMVVAAVFFVVSLGMAQQGGQTGGATPSAPGKGTPNPNPPSSTPSPNTQTPPPAPPTPRTIWLTGRVMMYDGGAPPESVTIERICSINSVRAEGYTDSQGRFSLTLGQDSGVFADASTSRFPTPGQTDVTAATSNTGSTTGRNRSNANPDPLLDCDLRARLSGYRSETISLAGRRTLDSPDVGVILLYPISKTPGLTASATSIQAPKDARRAYEKGIEAVKKDKTDQAENEFRKAVQIYPKYAEAWLELGKVLDRREDYPEAREAYLTSMAADSKYVYPYQQLYRMALREQNWKDLADRTNQLLHLNPYEFPVAYYFNALAHLELKEYEAAEKSAREAVEADRKDANPQAHYLLAAILVHKKAWAEAAECFRAYLKAAPNATDKAYVEKTLAQIDRQLSRAQPIPQDSLAQQ